MTGQADEVGPPVEESQSAIPLTILTGFLGAGKTTLLNRILGGSHGLRVAVLVNDFGSINVDAELVVGIEDDGDVISLANGCVCCNIRDDLRAAVIGVLDRTERPQYLLLEASGVADPSGIALTFLEHDIRDHIRLDSIMCVIDAEQVFAAPEMLELKLRQVAFADMIILNKVDLVTREEIDRIKSWLDDRFHRYRMVEAVGGDVPLQILISAGRLDPPGRDALESCQDEAAFQDGGHSHSQWETWTYESEGILSIDALREAARSLPTGVYRCKGFVHGAEALDHKIILQVVGKRVDIAVGEKWNGNEPRTRLIAIGARDALSGQMMQRVFDACQVEQQEWRPTVAPSPPGAARPLKSSGRDRLSPDRSEPS